MVYESRLTLRMTDLSTYRLLFYVDNFSLLENETLLKINNEVS